MNRRMIKRRRRRNSAITLFTIVVLFVALVAFLYFSKEPTVSIEANTRFPVGEKVSLYDLITEVKDGTLLTENTTLDSQKAGTRQIVLEIRDRLGRIRTKPLIVEFYDNIPPTITAPKSMTIMEGDTPPDLLKDASAVDENGVSCIVSLSGEYDCNKAGEYPLTFTAYDSTGNAATAPFVLKVLALPFDENGKTVDGTYTTRNGFTMVIKNGLTYVDGILIANKSYSLPKTYTSAWMTPETQAAYAKMQRGAQQAGYSIPVKSAYRSWYDQDWIFRDYVRRDGLEEALSFSARPGHSEHQTGLGLDLVTASTQESKSERIAPIMAWLNENAYKYGFILRYPEGKSDITGYIFEPWHYRYVGEELAQKLYNNGDWITLEEYFGIDSCYRGY